MAPITIEAGTVVAGKYRIQRLLGQGGMGTVWLAQHLLLDRKVALKILHARSLDNLAALERLKREGRALAKLSGKHLARVLDVEITTGGLCFLVLEFLEGEDLGTLLRSGPLSVRIAADYVLQACDAIAEAHVHGVVHRDLKPSNLYLTRLEDGSRGIKVIDFGISKELNPPLDLTESQAVIGSPCYMAPEQMRAGSKVDARCDIWSLGVVLFELLTGRQPYAGADVLEICAAILESDPPSASAVRPELPDGIDAVVQRCLARDPSDRFESVDELARALAPFGSSTGERFAWILSNRVSEAGSLDDPSGPRGSLDPVQTLSDRALPRAKRFGWRAALLPLTLVASALCFFGWRVVTTSSSRTASSEGRAATSVQRTATSEGPTVTTEQRAAPSEQRTLPSTESIREGTLDAVARSRDVSMPMQAASTSPQERAAHSHRVRQNGAPGTSRTTSQEPVSDPVLQYGRY